MSTMLCCTWLIKYEHYFVLQMVDYQMLKEDNSVLRRELDGMKM